MKRSNSTFINLRQGLRLKEAAHQGIWKAEPQRTERKDDLCNVQELRKLLGYIKLLRIFAWHLKVKIFEIFEKMTNPFL